ncbi:MAG: SDR family NAD(P)-dependent oxidoreductase [Eubacteriaceae bacterium]|nr:SDR family NAD(P)-dependent oxidoreductase [Eubacteriaceae bacterium]
MRSEIAVIGIGGVFPGAMDISEYWSNILANRDCTINIPDSYWDLSDFYDPNPLAKDKTYGYRAGLINYLSFNSIEYGIPPRIMESISVEQLFSLVVAKQTMLDAGLIGEGAKEFNRERAGVILSASVGKSSYMLSHRQTQNVERIMRNSHVPEFLIQRVLERMWDGTIEWNEASNPGYLPNVVAGRIGNRFDLNGTNCTVDAACAGSLAALKMAMNELISGDCDVMLTGGVMMDTTPFTFVAFSKTPAISPQNIARPFDKDSDGMLLGDGVGMMVIKRLADAERDGDRIYGVLESLSSSGDGKAKSIFAPRKEGQQFALERAYSEAGIDVSTVGLIEAHGTGTAVGDTVELEAINDFVKPYNMPAKKVALGSVKSQIGHTRLAAGAASLIKVLMALNQRVLPPTTNVTAPNVQLINSAFYLPNSPRPWVVNDLQPLRRAGISGFGFGGTNFHLVLREYIGPANENHSFVRMDYTPRAIAISAESKESLLKELELAEKELANSEIPNAVFNAMARSFSERINSSNARIGFVASNAEEAIECLADAAKLLRESNADQWHKRGIHYANEAVYGEDAKVAYLFPGQGSQYAGMLTQAAMAYPEILDSFTYADNALIKAGCEPVSEYVFPRLFPNEKPAMHEAELAKTTNAQMSLAAANAGLFKALSARGAKPSFFAGHSYGELSALFASGAIDEAALMHLSEKRAAAMGSAQESSEAGGMLAIRANWEQAEKLIEGKSDISIANENSPYQTVLSGSKASIASLAEELASKGAFAKELSVSGAFHSKYMQGARESFEEALSSQSFTEFSAAVYSNVTGKAYESPSDVAASLSSQLVSPVRFSSAISDMYENGARIFVEVGPGKVLTGLASQTLEGKKHTAIAINADQKEDSLLQLERAAMVMKVLGAEIEADPYARPFSEIKEEQPDNKRVYALPPLHFLMQDTQERIMDAVYKEDPPLSPDAFKEYFEDLQLAERQIEAAPASESKGEGKPEILRSPFSSNASLSRPTRPVKQAEAEPQAEPEEPKAALSEAKATSPPETKPPVAEAIMEGTDEIVEITQINKGTESMDNSDQTIPILDSAFGLQALNKEMFLQFTQSQGMQLEKFKEIIDSSGQAGQESLDSMLHFMELFQSNSMAAYNAYFDEQSKLLSNEGGEFSLSGETAGESPNTGFFQTSLLTPAQSAPRIQSSPPRVSPPAKKTAEEIQAEEKELKSVGFRAGAISASVDKAVEQAPKASVQAPPEPPQAAQAAPVAQEPEKPAEAATAPEAQAPSEIAAEPTELIAIDEATGELIEAEVVNTDSIFVMGVTKDQIEERIIEVISDRTGYPIEMIEPDMNIESDLGIDSIRRIEIFSVLNDEIERGFTQSDIETMAGLYSIEEFSEFLEVKLNSEDTGEETVHFDSDTLNSFITSGQMPEGMEIPDEYKEMAEAYQAQQAEGGELSLPAPAEKEEEAEAEVEIIEDESLQGSQESHGMLDSMPDTAIKRYDIVLEEISHPENSDSQVIAPSGAVAITLDNNGVSELIGEEMQRKGYDVAYISLPNSPSKEGAVKVAQPSSDEVDAALAAVAEKLGSAPVGFIHVCSPLYKEMHVLGIFDADEEAALESVFLFAAKFEGICAKPDEGKAFFMTISRIDGMHGQSSAWNGSSLQAGFTGLTKTLYREYRSVFAKAIDISHDTSRQLASELALEEIFAPEEDIYEVARDSFGSRYINTLKETEGFQISGKAPTQDDVFLVTGGARGVTFRCALQLGMQYGSKLALIGHSRLDLDVSWMNGHTEVTELRPLLIAKLREEGTTPQPKQVDSQIKEALNSLEIARNLAILEEKGIKAAYICCDIRDEAAVQSAIKQAEGLFGEITGLVHGAGAIADKDISKKTSDDFRLVFGTKITGLQNIIKSLNLRHLKFFAAFSSAASYFGNEKQADYTLANEILNKLANEVHKAHPEIQAMAINWGPWEGGMVSEALKTILIARKIDMVPFEQGSRLFAEQFAYLLPDGHAQFLIHSTDKYIDHMIGQQ